MARYWNEMNYPQPTEEELKENAKNTRKKAAAKGQTLHPIVIKSRQIANSWWGKAWCQNLERYADFDTRLPRGRRYVRTGAVIDLQIKKGKIQARVQGTRKTPYKVEIRISPLSERRIEEITGKCETRVETLDQLVNGDFPKELKDVFLEDGGLFPEPREISFSCSCPDWAVMCKHVAASLYGVAQGSTRNRCCSFHCAALIPINSWTWLSQAAWNPCSQTSISRATESFGIQDWKICSEFCRRKSCIR